MAQTLPDNAFNDGPYNPWGNGGKGSGDADDTAQYLLVPGSNFYRPWISVPNGRSFVWPLGVEGFSLSIDPTLGIHKYIGDNAVKVDVMHKGDERISLSGSFPGTSAVRAFQALRDIIYAETPNEGKILYVPHIFTYTQRVVVASARFDHNADDRGTDLSYSIDFVRLAPGKRVKEDPLAPTTHPPKTQGTPTARRFRTTSTINTIRKIAALKYKDSSQWRRIYNANLAFFRRKNITMFKAPDYRLSPGTVLYY